MVQTDILKGKAEQGSSCRPDDCPGSRPLHLPKLDETLIADASHIHKALSDETRLSILAYLQAGELCVCELLDALRMPQSTVSHHLFILQNAGLITSRKQGRWVLYSIDSDVLDRCNPFCEKE